MKDGETKGEIEKTGRLEEQNREKEKIWREVGDSGERQINERKRVEIEREEVKKERRGLREEEI